MNIREALKQVSWERQQYFLWKFPELARNSKQRTEEEFLKHVRRKNIETLEAWEMTSEYKHLVALYLEGRSASDMLEIYNSIAQKAKSEEGNETAVRVFLALRKQITEEAKAASDAFRELQQETEEEECELII